jgi:hypothetical protein
MFSLLISEIWKIYKGQCTADDIREQCNLSKIDYEKMKDYLTLETKTDGIMYDIVSNKFIVFMKEYLGSDSEGYADIIYFKLPLDCEELSMDILVEQFTDIRHVTLDLKSEREARKKDKEETRMLADSYEKMLEQKKNFEKKFFNKAAAVFNAKKLYIQENIADKVSKLNISHDVGTSDDLHPKNKKMEEKIYSSPSRTPSKRHSSTKINTTPNKRTPIKGTQRTPSKRLREIQDMSDSDDSFTVLSCDNSKKFSSKSVSESLDSSRVFKNFKIKTPVKQKDETRESSVELKIDRKTNEIKASDSESEHKSTESKGSNQQNAQQMEVDVDNNNKSQPLNADTVIDDEEIPCSQDLQEVAHGTSFSERMSLRLRNKSKKPKIDSSVNPYDVDTVNILNISD